MPTVKGVRDRDRKAGVRPRRTVVATAVVNAGALVGIPAATLRAAATVADDSVHVSPSKGGYPPVTAAVVALETGVAAPAIDAVAPAIAVAALAMAVEAALEIDRRGGSRDRRGSSRDRPSNGRSTTPTRGQRGQRPPAAPAGARWCDAHLAGRCNYQETYGKACPRPHIDKQNNGAIVATERANTRLLDADTATEQCGKGRR